MKRCLALLLVWGFAGTAFGEERGAAPVEFNRDIRPILSDNCYVCHGPAKSTRKADLRLDTEAGALADRGGYQPVVPRHPERSELLKRLRSSDPTRHMPPARTGKRLSPEQIDRIERWIAQGARWQPHWSLIAPRRPVLPAVKDHDWPRNPIDSFILARLEKEGLRPASQAPREALLRRVTLDLTGLPPSLAEVDAFCADRSPGAYERLVERLLASPRYGERQAELWLDAARFADTNGYQTDGERTMWRWRDWVIEAFNDNVPFDQFTVEQLAGDLLPNPTLEQRIATGFNRNHRGNSEGGVIPEEFAVEYVVDRVDTTCTVWLGLTAGCARCHDHKYDPISQKEFYGLFAYFNNVPEKGKAIKYGNSPPYIKAPTRDQQAALARLTRQLSLAETALRQLQPALASLQSHWESSPEARRPVSWSLTEARVAAYPLDGTPAEAAGGKPTQFRDGAPAYGPGRRGLAAVLDGRRYLDMGDVADFGFFDRFSLAAWVRPDGPDGGTIVSRMVDEDRGEGYSVSIRAGQVHVHLVKRWLDDALRVHTRSTLSPSTWHHVLVTYDGSRVAAGIKVYLDGQPAQLRVDLDDINQSFKTTEPLRVGAGGGPHARFRGGIGDVSLFREALGPDEAALVATPENVHQIAALSSQKRTHGQQVKLRSWFLREKAPPAIRQAHARVQTLRRQHRALWDSIPTSMVMEEMPRPRDTFLLVRGEYDKKGPKIGPGLPAALAPRISSMPRNRLDLARWLVDPANPLTARVAVNRTWQELFGVGLVKSVEDLGAQGEWPSHPKLLDWLATEFVRTGWDVKALHRLLVTSATYRQASRADGALRQRDPENRLLACGPRVRLSARAVRDQALFVSGLLVERLGGPSVKPYQPAGLWEELSGDPYEQDHGDKLYRRGLYTFWKRTAAPPALVLFDAAGRETCVVRQGRTNTPLQALNLLNDVTHVEAARKLAERLLHEGGESSEERLTLAFRLATARRPRPAELEILRAGLEHHRNRFRNDPRAARAFIRAGESLADSRLDRAELAAYTAMANLILNLDEVITRP